MRRDGWQNVGSKLHQGNQMEWRTTEEVVVEDARLLVSRAAGCDRTAEAAAISVYQSISHGYHLQ
jgi:hypothetical protein